MSRADRLLQLDKPRGQAPAPDALKRDPAVVHESGFTGTHGESPPTSAQRLPVLYHLSEAVNAATDEYADRIAAADYQLNKLLPDGEVEMLKVHPGLGLLENPNPYWTHYQLFKSIPTDMLSNGNSYQFMAGPDGGAPNELWWLNPRDMRIVRDKERYILGYIYNVDNIDVPLFVEEVLHWQQTTPLDDLYGIPKLRTADQAATTERAMGEYNRNFFAGGAGVPAGIVSTDASINDSDWQRTIKQWEARHGSQRRTAFMRGALLKYEPAGLTQRDMDFVEGTKLQIAQIYTAYRTWHLIGEYDAKAAERWFLEAALWPLMRYIAEVYTDQFFSMWGPKPSVAGHLTFVFDDIRPRERALELEEVRERNKRLFFNEVRQLEGLESIPEWDGILWAHAQQGIAPLAEQPEPDPITPSDAPPDPEPSNESDATQPEDAQERAERRESAADDVGDDIGAFADKSATHKALKAWRKIATEDRARGFTNDAIPPDFANAVRAALSFAGDYDTMRHVFKVAHNAVAFEWRNEYAELKAIQATRLDFESEFSDLLALARDGDINRIRWGQRARTVLRRNGESAYRDGLNDGGVPIAEGEPLSEPDQIELSMLLQGQSQFVTELGKVLFKGDGVSDAQADIKPEMWFNKSILPIYQAGRVSADANAPYLWIFNPLKDNCVTCTRANGQVHRLRDWHRSGILPKADTLECGGFECGCRLQRAPGARSQGRLAAIPTKAHEPGHDEDEDREMVTMPDGLPDGLRQLNKHIVSITEDGGEFAMHLQPVRNQDIYRGLTEADIQQGLTLMGERLQLVGHELQGDDLIVRFTIEGNEND